MPPKRVRHIVGSARTIRTAVLVSQYLKHHCCAPHSDVHKDAVIYEFLEPRKENGYWSANILIDQTEVKSATVTLFVDTCRAFVAGAGEIW